MEDNIQEMYDKARKAFKEIEFWPQEKVDEMVLAVSWELMKEDVRKKLGNMAVDESGIGNANDTENAALLAQFVVVKRMCGRQVAQRDESGAWQRQLYIGHIATGVTKLSCNSRALGIAASR